MARHDPDEDGGGGRLWLARWLFSPLAGVTFGDWMGLLARYGAGVSAVYAARAVMTTAMAAMNSPIAWAERRRIEGRLGEVAVRRPVFVLGHHRSGTTHLWNLLAQDRRFAWPNVLQAVFPHTFLTVEGVARGLARRLAPKRRPQDTMRFGPEAAIEEERAICAATFLSVQMARHFPRRRAEFQRFLTLDPASEAERRAWAGALDLFARKLLLRQGGERTLLFKSPEHTAKIALLLSLYPDARFVHIHRDPYAVFQSTRNMERVTAGLYAYQRPDDRTLDDFILWRYRAMYDAFFRDLPSVPPGRLAELSFAELEGEPVAAVERVYRALDLPDFDAARSGVRAYAASLAGYRRNTYRALDAATRRRVAEAWAASFERWGYAA
ncbi:MAG: sulfotransferase [Caulobacterales bacterium]|nr:sulfotransferase [Caulobacterales bacterium]